MIHAMKLLGRNKIGWIWGQPLCQSASIEVFPYAVPTNYKGMWDQNRSLDISKYRTRMANLHFLVWFTNEEWNAYVGWFYFGFFSYHLLGDCWNSDFFFHDFKHWVSEHCETHSSNSHTIWNKNYNLDKEMAKLMCGHIYSHIQIIW